MVNHTPEDKPDGEAQGREAQELRTADKGRWKER